MSVFDSRVPEVRLRTVNPHPVRATGDFVLYWMIANRRSGHNFSLERACEWSRHLGKPLVIFEALRSDYPWASDRIHQFVIEGMRANQKAFASTPATYYPYLEPRPGAGKGALAALAQQATVVVSDDFPCFFLPAMIQAAARQIPVRLELVDSNGLFPMRATTKVFARAFDFRRHLQKNLLPHLLVQPLADPFQGDAIPRLARGGLTSLQQRWMPVDGEHPPALTEFPIDHHVAVVRGTVGGSPAAEDRLQAFLEHKIQAYGERRNEPEQDVTSGLSPYLHFGHLSAHQIFQQICKRWSWLPEQVNPAAQGSAQGWWGLPAEVESFLDELITWRELGYNICAHTDNFDQYESLPEWSRQTLEKHRRDPRSHVYSQEQFEAAGTHDRLWNAAQTQLIREGRIHNYLRMLWGKKVLEWSPSPEAALQTLIHLNNKYALDGRNPNSYSGIFWCLGRYDRAWGPERPVYGTVRYMSSENTARKVSVKGYLEKYGPHGRLAFPD